MGVWVYGVCAYGYMGGLGLGSELGLRSGLGVRVKVWVRVRVTQVRTLSVFASIG